MGIRAHVEPDHWDSLALTYTDVLEWELGVGFMLGEVTKIDASEKCAYVRTVFSELEDIVPFDYCIVAVGCKSPHGSSSWLPTVNLRERVESGMDRALDERKLEGRRRRIIQEHQHLVLLNRMKGTVMIVGARFYGVECACQIKHAFPDIDVVLVDVLKRCLGPLSQEAAEFCQKHMDSVGIRTIYNANLNINQRTEITEEFCSSIGVSEKVDKIYFLSGVKHCNNFLPTTTQSEEGYGGMGWILINQHFQVVTRGGEEWGHGCIFAVGDCNIVNVRGNTSKNAPLPKTVHVAEEQAVQACRNIQILDRRLYGGCLPCNKRMRSSSEIRGAGLFILSLGREDGCFLAAGISGKIRCRGLAAVVLKDTIESTKLAHYRGDHRLSKVIWYLVHHWCC